MTEGEIPNWAYARACKAAGRRLDHFDRMSMDLPLRQSIAAHAALIAKHEKPPVDRVEACIDQAYWLANERSRETGEVSTWDDVARNAIRLWIEGYNRDE